MNGVLLPDIFCRQLALCGELTCGQSASSGILGLPPLPCVRVGCSVVQDALHSRKCFLVEVEQLPILTADEFAETERTPIRRYLFSNRGNV